MIDPNSFSITLFGGDGTSIAKQRLSEGEKQIFAISVLWGLALRLGTVLAGDYRHAHGAARC